MGSDLVFVVKVTLPAKAADEMRRVEDFDGTIVESSDEAIIADALNYFSGFHYDAVLEIEARDAMPDGET